MDERRAHAAVEAVWRIESGRLVAGLARLVRDVGLAEELAQDALVRALEVWPRAGVPENPGAWLMATGKHAALDRLRRDRTLERKEEQLVNEAGARFALSAAEVAVAREEDLGDDLLTLVLTCCHPVLSPAARTALTLRAVAGLTTEEIARAFLLPVPTVAQRIVRARRTLKEEGVGFTAPAPDELAERLDSALEIVYLVFNEGYTATTGEDWMRPALCSDALRLGRVLASLLPQEPEVHGLVALMELQAARIGARTDTHGAPVLLDDQDRARWDRLLLGRGLAALKRAEALGGALGLYALQAAIAACHARAPSAAATDWPQIALLYSALAERTGSPVVELNRAVAVGRAEGPAPGLAIVERLLGEDALPGYHLLPAVHGDLLERLGRDEYARAAFTRAASLATNARERELLAARAAGADRRVP
ncbi:MAG: sigma-70 family RNA polymerase sigma factor [Solirubrobacterales bacterium]|nr:sigma-70 family RNA polymerase sigma factor [Solirubrobacterales bacterium]